MKSVNRRHFLKHTAWMAGGAAAFPANAAAAAITLPRPLVGSGESHFSFAGLKSAVQRAVAGGEHSRENVAASFQQAVVDVLIDHTFLALEQHNLKQLALAGGVAANSCLRRCVADRAAADGRAGVVHAAWDCCALSARRRDRRARGLHGVVFYARATSWACWAR